MEAWEIQDKENREWEKYYHELEAYETHKHEREQIERENARRTQEEEERESDRKREETKEAEARKREEAKDKLEEERETRERERSERGEKRGEAHEALEEKEKKELHEEQETTRRVQPPPTPGFSAGGGPSLLLGVPQQGFLAFNELITGGANKYVSTIYKETTSLMGERSVSPGTQWSIWGGYVKLPIWTLLLSEKLKGVVGYVSFTFSLFRNTSPIWHGGAAESIAFHEKENAEQQSFSNFITGIEFSSPVVLGAGENITVEIRVEASIAWSEVEAGGSFTEAQINSTSPAFGSTSGQRSGAFRYNVETTK